MLDSDSPTPSSREGDFATSGRVSTKACQYFPNSMFNSIFSCFTILSRPDIILWLRGGEMLPVMQAGVCGNKMIILN
jgi:hypothetical protein